jgi:membrane associated rhomboid family serine protease
VSDETPRCYRHADRETLVSCAECGRPICEECMTFAPVGIKCPEHAGVGAPRSTAQQTVRHARARADGLAAPATVVLVAINVVVYLVTIFQGGGINQPGGELFERGALQGAVIAIDGEWYRLVSAMFLHASVLHLAFNMFALYWLGSMIEQALGTRRYLLVYFVAGIAGSAGALVSSTAFAVTVGASGAIFGIMGAFLILEYLATGSLAGQALGLIGINLILTFAIAGISKGGHVGGLIGGIAATYALAHFRYDRRRWLGPALAALVGVAAIVVAVVRVRGYGL